MYGVSRVHRHSVCVCDEQGTQALWAKQAAVCAPPTPSSFSPFQSGLGWSLKGHLWPLSSRRAVAAKGKLLRPHVHGSSFCLCVNWFDISTMYFFFSLAFLSNCHRVSLCRISLAGLEFSV